MMKISKIAAALLLLTASAPVFAQSVPDDARCLVLSNAFAKGATDTRARQAAAQSMIFYLGRLDGRAAPRVIADAMRAQSDKIDPKTASSEMNACAGRVGHAMQAIQALTKPAAPAKK
jgi:hypothetical protein